RRQSGDLPLRADELEDIAPAGRRGELHRDVAGAEALGNQRGIEHALQLGDELRNGLVSGRGALRELHVDVDGRGLVDRADRQGDVDVIGQRSVEMERGAQQADLLEGRVGEARNRYLQVEL